MVRSGNIPVWKEYGYQPRADRSRKKERAKILIVGAGPVGLAMALDLGRRGLDVIIINALDFIPAGSKAICFSKRSLEIFDRLGVGDRLLEKGVVWERGKVFWREGADPIYEFDLAPIKDQKYPAFINIQQYYVEEYLVDEVERTPSIDLRWRHEATKLIQSENFVAVAIETPDEAYEIEADYVIACDGNRSPVRNMLGLDFVGRIFEDNFLIADIRLKQERPAERWFHFEPPWPGASSLVHKQPDDVWRLDFQLGWDIDKKEAVKPENVRPFVRGLLGDHVDYEFEWLSVYTFQCRRMERFLHDRVIFVGDSAHLVSPFGARGCNGGLQDVINLGWKLERVLNGSSSPALLETYNAEAITVADENILNSTRSTDFMTPKSKMAETFRNAVLELASEHQFARPFVNSGRLSKAVNYGLSALATLDEDHFLSGPAPGDICIDAPIVSDGDNDWLLSQLGPQFTLLLFSTEAIEAIDGVAIIEVRQQGGAPNSGIVDHSGLAHERYDADGGAVYLIRPDQHVAARWRTLDRYEILKALSKATGGELQ
ncbi:MAG: FAD-dependent oxidoreductase [Parvularculaceae bacterium]